MQKFQKQIFQPFNKGANLMKDRFRHRKTGITALAFLLVIVIVLVMNISSRRTEKKGERAA